MLAQDVFLVCHLRFIANRPLGIDLGLEDFPRVSALIERLEARQSFRENPILWWEPGVVGYTDDERKPVYKT